MDIFLKKVEEVQDVGEVRRKLLFGQTGCFSNCSIVPKVIKLNNRNKITVVFDKGE